MEGLAGIGAALSAMAISFVLLAYPAYFASKALRLPWIYDITTDPIDPPRYEALARLRPRDANPVAYAGLYAAEQQRLAYPDVAPLGTNSTAQAAYDAALAAINKRRWRVVDARSPQAGRREGRVEAVARTAIMGFRDDVVVRVRPEPDGARIDARSSSRYGTFDFGANAARIRSLDERDRGRHADAAAGAAAGAFAWQEIHAGQEAEGSAQTVAALDRGLAVGRHETARHQILEMGENR